MHGSAVRGLRLIDTSRRGARDLSCLHGRDCAARKVRASASEVKDGGGYDHPLTRSQGRRACTCDASTRRVAVIMIL